MPILPSSEYRLRVELATAGQFAEIAGQQGLKYDVKANLIDTSNKSTGSVASSYPGRNQIEITLSGIAILPDQGFTRAETLLKNRQATPIRIVRGTSTIVVEGQFYVAGLSNDYPSDGVVTYEFLFVAADAPTTWALQ